MPNIQALTFAVKVLQRAFDRDETIDVVDRREVEEAGRE